ncbi:MAG: TIGR01212 family radical SAM protein [Tissierellia bacterium]|nr:TIGR01212 family radical SAM protein [Tissierellia bacterium]
MTKRYTVYSESLRKKYGEKTYKLPIKLDNTCPNRDGRIGTGGCSFCGESGGSFENLSPKLSVKEQLYRNRKYIASRYGAKKFIAYFQNYSNTYMPLPLFEEIMTEAAKEDIVGLCLSTRPDCVNEKHLDFLENLSKKYSIDIIFELGLQSVNLEILRKYHRGHGIADYIRSVLRIKHRGFEICTHLIIGPKEEKREDIIEAAKLLSYLHTDEVKIHSLYIPKNTLMEKEYQRGKLEIIPLEEYVQRVVLFLRYLDPAIAVQRLVGRMPEENTVFCNWGRSWWIIRDQIEELLEEKKAFQGDLLEKDGILL